MKSMIFFGLLCACAARPQIFTPEVQAERQRFFQLFNQQAAAAAAAPDIAIFPQHKTHHQTTHQQQHHQPSHQQQHHQSTHRFAPQPAQSPFFPPWQGPLAATVPAGLPGSVSQVGNTPEVEAAIAEFSRAFNAALVSTQPRSPVSLQQISSVQRNTGHFNPNQFNAGHFNPTHQISTHQSEPAQPRWTGALASDIPAGLPGSPAQVAETQEVQAAKAAFSRAFTHQLRSVVG